MRNRADEIRQRYRDRIKSSSVVENHYSYPKNIHFEEDDDQEKKKHPLFHFPFFLFQILVSICLFLAVGIAFKNHNDEAIKAQRFVKKLYNEEFQFASVKKWYENQFGKPLALFPDKQKTSTSNDKTKLAKKNDFSVPVNGRVYESFQKNGKGILIETGKNSNVDTLKDGYVTFVGDKGNLGKTVIIQHSDGEESWYGMLDSVNRQIKLYSYIKSGITLGKVTPNKDGKTGTYYLAIKKGDEFIDPSKVINFE
ncbi:M23 family metallopeptidase [Fictibacillus sp. Mic-4]|uniref:peptidoglycan DD-metalloendopeptidase family protein n=1 Tax=Fictibacillus sp. Mic-4 TaxID=3132826 RepID=UPI003CF64E90